MSNEIIKTSEIPHDELVYIYEQRCTELKKEHQDNVHLKAENKRLTAELERLRSKIKSALL